MSENTCVTDAGADEVRSRVAAAYAERVSAPPTAGCGCGNADSSIAVAEMIGYDRADLTDLPTNAVGYSFGCGDPLSLAEIDEGDVVLDLGSGAGMDLLLAARKVGSSGRVIGVDMTDEMIARATENVRTAGHTNVEVRKGIIEDLPIEDSSVDWVISNCVINLSPEKHRAFAEIARVLKPGGRMLVSDMMVEDLPGWVRSEWAACAGCVGGAISEDEYVAGLRRAGLTDVEVRARLVYDAAEALGGKIWSAKVYARKTA